MACVTQGGQRRVVGKERREDNAVTPSSATRRSSHGSSAVCRPSAGLPGGFMARQWPLLLSGQNSERCVNVRNCNAPLNGDTGSVCRYDQSKCALS